MCPMTVTADTPLRQPVAGIAYAKITNQGLININSITYTNIIVK
jgi:hypothetical protein